jgi:hypothetical protein
MTARNLLDEDRLAEILGRNPQLNRMALERSRKAARRLAELGIDGGTYRLEPALGGNLLENEQADARIRSQQGRGG